MVMKNGQTPHVALLTQFPSCLFLGELKWVQCNGEVANGKLCAIGHQFSQCGIWFLVQHLDGQYLPNCRLC